MPVQELSPGSAGLERVATQSDPFGHKAPKLAALLGQSSAARVLLVGPTLKIWAGDFAGYFNNLVHAQSITDLDASLSTAATFDLILLSLDGIAGSGRSVRDVLGKLGAALAENGTLILLAENRLALARLARRPLALFSAGKATAPGIRLAVSKAGFRRVEEFVPLPRFAGAEEFVSARHGDAALPNDASPIEVGLNRLGLLPFFSEGWCVVCSSREGGTRALLNKIARELRLGSRSENALVLERFDLRDRGALVLLLRGRSDRRRFVCRITTDERSDRSVRLNAEWIERIHRSPAISGDIKARVPKPLGTFVLNSGKEYLETLVDGVLAWKLAGNSRLEPVMFRGMCDFLFNLDQQTSEEATIDASSFVQLSGSNHSLSMDGETAALVEELTEKLRRRTLGTHRRLTWSHGDFGYGNAIADPVTGKLAGIIDWDQARADFAGVDLLNFLLFREHSKRAKPIAAMFTYLADRIAGGGLHSFEVDSRFEKLLPLGNGETRGMLSWVALRITQRAATYPALLARSRQDVHSILRWASATLEK